MPVTAASGVTCGVSNPRAERRKLVQASESQIYLSFYNERSQGSTTKLLMGKFVGINSKGLSTTSLYCLFDNTVGAGSARPCKKTPQTATPSGVPPKALRHSFGELKLISSKFSYTQHSANKFASVFVCTNFSVLASIATVSQCPPKTGGQ